MTTENINCKRCGTEGRPPEFIPYSGELWEKIVKNVCAECWEEWKKASVMVINEYRLTPFLPEHRKILQEQMFEFLKLNNS